MGNSREARLCPRLPFHALAERLEILENFRRQVPWRILSKSLLNSVEMVLLSYLFFDLHTNRHDIQICGQNER